jgi:hypothetical protein
MGPEWRTACKALSGKAFLSDVRRLASLAAIFQHHDKDTYHGFDLIAGNCSVQSPAALA